MRKSANGRNNKKKKPLKDSKQLYTHWDPANSKLTIRAWQ
jgi:hypothetical protein